MNVITRVIRKIKLYKFYSRYFYNIKLVNFIHRNTINLIYFLRISIFNKNTPIIIYSNQKTSSESLKYSLYNANIKELHKFHYLKEINIKLQEKINGKRTFLFNNIWFYKLIIKRKKSLKLITLLRNPIERDISKFFHSFNAYFEKGNPSNYTFRKLYDVFMKNVFNFDGTSYFDNEFKDILGINLYKYPFDKQKGHSIYKFDNIELLILKSELKNEIKEKILKEFLNLKYFKIINTNMAKDKDYAKEYVNFKEKMRFSNKLLYYYLDSRYMKHFYTKNERIDLYNKYR